MIQNLLSPTGDLNDPLIRAQLQRTLEMLCRQVTGGVGPRGAAGPPGAGGEDGDNAFEDENLSVVLRRAASQSIPNATDTDVEFDTEDHDEGDWWASGDSTKVYVPAESAGKRMRVIGYALWATSTDGKPRLLYVSRYNSADVLQQAGITDIRQGMTTATWDSTNLVTLTTSPVSAGDYFKLRVRQDSGGNLNCTGYLSIEVAR